MDQFKFTNYLRFRLLSGGVMGLSFLAFRDVILFSPVAKYQEATCSTIKR